MCTRIAHIPVGLDRERFYRVSPRTGVRGACDTPIFAGAVLEETFSIRAAYTEFSHVFRMFALLHARSCYGTSAS